MATTDIKELFRRAFGYEAPENFSIEHAPARVEKSQLGQSYYHTDSLGREFFLPVSLGTWFLPFAVIGITCKKTIVETSMPERNGSVIEQISTENYLINIKGILINDDNSYPDGWITILSELFDKNESLELRSVLTDIFLKGGSDHKVVLKSIAFPAIAGVEDSKAYEMELISDSIFELEIN